MLSFRITRSRLPQDLDPTETVRPLGPIELLQRPRHVSQPPAQTASPIDELPATHIGSRAVVRRSDLEAYVANLTNVTDSCRLEV